MQYDFAFDSAVGSAFNTRCSQSRLQGNSRRRYLCRTNSDRQPDRMSTSRSSAKEKRQR